MLGQESLEFLYPVAQIDESTVLVVYQKSFDQLELWITNNETKISFKEISSSFFPSFVKLLPSKKSFSFIDRGRIKIKPFDRRTPRSIDIYEPISAISNMHWIDDGQFYFTAKHEGKFGIFLCEIVDKIVKISCLSNLNTTFDYLYPQKINDDLFCIIKDESNNHSICKLPWAPKNFKTELHAVMQSRALQGESNSGFLQINSHEIIIPSQSNPFCFLHMQSHNLGFVIEFKKQDQDSLLFDFACHRLELQPDQLWNLKKLFDFQLPKNLLIGSKFEKIFESIYPFLPLYGKKFIYFVNFDQEFQACRIMRYDQDLDKVEKTIQDSPQTSNCSTHFFAPCIVKDAICAGIAPQKPLFRSCQLMTADQATGIFQCELPEIEF